MTVNIFKTLKLIIITLIITVSIHSIGIAKTTNVQPTLPWKVWKQSNSLSVSSRASTIDQIIEIKATILVNSSLSGFLLFMQDANNTPAWLTNASDSEVIKELSVNEHIFTVSFSANWPLKARHLQLHSHYWQNSNLSVEIELKDDFSIDIPHSNAVRIKFYKGRWLLTPLLNNEQQKQLIIEYTFTADSSGDMPKWFADQLALKSTLKSMKKMSQQLPQSQWQQQTIPGITELSL